MSLSPLISFQSRFVTYLLAFPRSIAVNTALILVILFVYLVECALLCLLCFPRFRLVGHVTCSDGHVIFIRTENMAEWTTFHAEKKKSVLSTRGATRVTNQCSVKRSTRNVRKRSTEDGVNTPKRVFLHQNNANKGSWTP